MHVSADHTAYGARAVKNASGDWVGGTFLVSNPFGPLKARDMK